VDRASGAGLLAAAAAEELTALLDENAEGQ
jgi:hypothetical protein